MAMEVLSKGPILDWTSNGKLYARFLEWTEKVSVSCKLSLRITKAVPKFTCLCIYLVRRVPSKCIFRQGDVSAGIRPVQFFPEDRQDVQL